MNQTHINQQRGWGVLQLPNSQKSDQDSPDKMGIMWLKQ
jgi:hypothetical protein